MIIMGTIMMNIKKTLFLLILLLAYFALSAEGVLMLKPEGSVYTEKDGILTEIAKVPAGTRFDINSYSEKRMNISVDGSIVENDVIVHEVLYQDETVYVKKSEAYEYGGAIGKALMAENAVIYDGVKHSSFTNKILKKKTAVIADWEEIDMYEESENKDRNELTRIIYWDEEEEKIKRASVLIRKIDPVYYY